MVTYNELFAKEASSEEREAMSYWRKYSEEYRRLIPEYEELIREKRRLNIGPLRKINLVDLRTYPQIELFEIDDEGKAQYYVGHLPGERLEDEVQKIKYFIESRIRRILLGRILDYKQQIRLSKCRKSPLLMDPDCSGRYKFRGYRTSRRTLSDGDSGE